MRRRSVSGHGIVQPNMRITYLMTLISNDLFMPPPKFSRYKVATYPGFERMKSIRLAMPK